MCSSAAYTLDPKLREVAERLGRELGLQLIVLFGSSARPGDTPEDLDLAVSGDEPCDTVDVTNRFAGALGRSDVDIVDLRRADPLLLMEVAEHGIALFERDPGTFTSFYSFAVRRFADTRKFREAERQAIREYIVRKGHAR